MRSEKKKLKINKRQTYSRLFKCEGYWAKFTINDETGAGWRVP